MFHPFPACALCYCSSLFTGTSPLKNEIILTGYCLQKENFTLLIFPQGKGLDHLLNAIQITMLNMKKDGKETKQEVHKSSLIFEKND